MTLRKDSARRPADSGTAPAAAPRGSGTAGAAGSTGDGGPAGADETRRGAARGLVGAAGERPGLELRVENGAAAVGDADAGKNAGKAAGEEASGGERPGRELRAENGAAADGDADGNAPAADGAFAGGALGRSLMRALDEGTADGLVGALVCGARGGDAAALKTLLALEKEQGEAAEALNKARGEIAQLKDLLAAARAELLELKKAQAAEKARADAADGAGAPFLIELRVVE